MKKYPENTLIITATRRQAQYLRLQDKLSQCLVYSWADWLQFSWQQYHNQLLPSAWLDSFQQKLLWEKLLHLFPFSEYASQAPSLCSALQDLWQKINFYQIPLDALRDKNQPNNWLYQICNAYKSEITHQHQYDDASWLHTFIEHIKNFQNLPEHWVFYSFLDKPPLLKALIKALSANGQQVHHEQPWQQNTMIFSAEQHQCSSPEHELEAMLNWVKQHAEHLPKGQQLACIVPNLSERKAELEYHLQNIIGLGTSNFFNDETQKIWHFSLADKLTQLPLIDTALTLLELIINEDITLNEFESLLRSPYWGDITNDEIERTRWLNALRQLSWENLTLSLICQEHYCSSLSSTLQRAKNLLSGQKLLPSDWCLIWQQQLNLLLWPGRIEHLCNEQATVERWQKMLEDFSKLDDSLGTLSAKQAKYRLQQFAEQILFDPAPRPQAPIQIMGLLEAVGLRFENAWLLSADSRFWPPTAKTNFLLPVRIQKHFGLILDTEQKLHAEKQLYQALCQSCNTLIASYPEQVDGQSTQLSPLIAQLPAASSYHQKKTNEYKNVGSKKSMDTSLAGLAVNVKPDEAVSGGSGALRSQSACPFQAFAKFRLCAKTLPETCIHITLIERGQMLHAALQIIWQHLHSQEKLLSLSGDSLTTLIKRAVKLSLRQIFQKRRKLLSKTLIELELRRLEALLTRWLNLEKMRPPFTVIATEAAAEVQFADACWRVRVDRIDQLQNGKMILFDYKTGLSNINSWQGERLAEPQLPFYALTQEPVPHGIVFAILRADRLKISGLADEEMKWAELGEIFAVQNWHEQLEVWQNNLSHIAISYLTGIANIDPRDETVCQQCDFQSLCRINV